MKQLYITLAIVLCAFISCENDHLENYVDTNQPENIAVPNIGELSTFNVAIDTSSLAETEVIPSANEDYIWLKCKHIRAIRRCEHNLARSKGRSAFNG